MTRRTSTTLAAKFADWLAKQGKAEGAQTFDNKPQGFVEEFPAKADIQIAADALEQRLWWSTPAFCCSTTQ